MTRLFNSEAARLYEQTHYQQVRFFELSPTIRARAVLVIGAAPRDAGDYVQWLARIQLPTSSGQLLPSLCFGARCAVAGEDLTPDWGFGKAFPWRETAFPWRERAVSSSGVTTATTLRAALALAWEEAAAQLAPLQAALGARERFERALELEGARELESGSLETHYPSSPSEA